MFLPKKRLAAAASVVVLGISAILLVFFTILHMMRPVEKLDVAAPSLEEQKSRDFYYAWFLGVLQYVERKYGGDKYLEDAWWLGRLDADRGIVDMRFTRAKVETAPPILRKIVERVLNASPRANSIKKPRIFIASGCGKLCVNAWAWSYPDGTIIFTAASVIFAENEAELAGLAAHEAAHVLEKHGFSGA